MLTSKQRAYLRSLANTLPCLYQIGKEGVSESVVKQLMNAMNANEMIKVGVLNNSPVTAREAMEKLSGALSANPVSVVGSKLVLYKPAMEPEKRKIVLPKPDRK